MFETEESSSTRREVVIAGALPPDGPVLRVWVPHRGDHARYRVRLLQVAAEDFTLGDLSVYGSVISRLSAGRGAHLDVWGRARSMRQDQDPG